MRIIRLYSFKDFNFEIDTDSHQVSDPKHSNFWVVIGIILTFIKIIITTLIIIIIALSMYFAVIWLFGFTLYYLAESLGINFRNNKIINAFLAGAIIGVAISLFKTFGKIIMSYISENISKNIGKTNLLRQNFRQNSKRASLTPEFTLKYFLTNIGNELYRHAYNLLTDQAKALGRVDFPRETSIQKIMPDLVIEDYNSFKNFWRKTLFNWPVLIEKIKNKDYEIKSQFGSDYSHTAILEVTIKSESETFTSKFILVKRHGFWFLVNGFFWPS